MGIRHNRTLLGKMLLLLLVIVVGGVTVFGCVGAGARPMGWSGAVVADGTLFLGSMEGKLVAVNIADGSSRSSEPLQVKQTGGFGCAPVGGGGCAASPTGVAIYGTPAVAGDLVYIGGYNGKIYAFNSSSLEMRWVYPRDGSLQPIVGGPVVAQDKVYIGCADGKVYALDAATGDPEWDSPFETKDKIWSTPAIDGDALYIGSFDKKLYAIDAITGKAKWQQPFETQGAIVSTPLVYNNMVYIGSLDRHVYAVSASGGGMIWKSSVEAVKWFWAKPIAYNNTIYAGNLDGKVYILNAETGDEVVEAIDLGSPISSSPVLVDDVIIIASEDGQVWTVDTGNNEKRLLKDLGEKIYAPLCAGEGVVYVHTQRGILYEVDVQTGVIRKLYPIE